MIFKKTRRITSHQRDVYWNNTTETGKHPKPSLLVRLWGERLSPSLLVGYELVEPFWNNNMDSSDNWRLGSHSIQHYCFWEYILGAKTHQKHNLHFYIHWNAIYNSQNLEETLVPQKLTGEKKLWYIWTMKYYADIRKTQWSHEIHLWVDAHGRYHAAWNNSAGKGHILNDLICIEAGWGVGTVLEDNLWA